MKQRKGLESLGDRLVHNCHEPSQSGTLIRLFLASFRSKTEMQLISNDAEMLRATPHPGGTPLQGLTGGLRQPGYVFQDCCLKQGIDFIFLFF